jgi:hypothetical protein
VETSKAITKCAKAARRGMVCFYIIRISLDIIEGLVGTTRGEIVVQDVLFEI